MSKSVKIVIGGKDYSLKGDDESVIRIAANEVNKEISFLEKNFPEESPATISVLTALNLAEKNIAGKKQKEVDESFLIEQINKMSDYLSKVLRFDITNEGV
jgi:cell division protein ZapA (FtsZ GTPase activity inhibitor)